jgi:hypothetical protein
MTRTTNMTTIALLSVIIYLIASLVILRGSLFPSHYYSFNTISECKKNKTFVSNNLEIFVQGDSIKAIKKLNKKFFTCKLMYEQYYGFLVSMKKEDKSYRRLQWYENDGFIKDRNWIITKDDKYIGEAFYSGSIDVKIGDTVKLNILNFNPEYEIGVINVVVK